MSLHCLYAGVDSPTAQRLLSVVGDGDVVLLLGEAVVLARRGESWLQDLPVPAYALAEDLTAYGVVEPDPRVSAVDYAGWLSLAETQTNQCLWR